MYKDERADPPALICQVGPTTLKYHLWAIDDLRVVSAQCGPASLPAAPGAFAPANKSLLLRKVGP